MLALQLSDHVFELIHPRNLNHIWFTCQPQTVFAFVFNPFVDAMAKQVGFKASEILSENVTRLKDAKPDASSQGKVGKRAGKSQSTIGRIINEQINCRANTIGDVAEAFNLEPWQILVPGFDPRLPPELMPSDPGERKAVHEFIQFLRKSAKSV